MMTAIVTGSSSGIGLGMALRLHDAGWNVLVNGYDTEEAGGLIVADLPRAIYVDADVSDPAEAERIAVAALQAFGSIDLLVNNAGIARPIPHDDLDAVTDEFWDRIMRVNLKGPWNMSRALRPHLADRGGQIVNIASIAGLVPMGSSIPYAVSKAGVVHLTVLLAKALGPSIRVNAIAPAYIDTPLTHDWEELRQFVLTSAPARRLGQPDDVADALMGLLAMDYVTGVVLPVDGGLRLI